MNRDPDSWSYNQKNALSILIYDYEYAYKADEILITTIHFVSS